MIKTILHQMWNERRQNGWLFLELVAVSVFLWLAIDPLFVLVSRGNIPQGYNTENLYRISLNEYIKTNIKYQPEADGDSVKMALYRNAFDIIRKIPEVQYVGTCTYNQYFNSGSNSSTYLTIDSTSTADGKEKSVSAWFYTTSAEEGDDFPATFGLIDAHTGKTAHIVHDENVNKIYVTRNFAMEGFGTIDVVGKRVKSYNKTEYVICGVLENIQTMLYANYMNVIIYVKPTLQEQISIHVRLKEGVNADEFIRNFNKVYAPRLSGGNIYCDGIIKHSQQIREVGEQMGYENTYRLQTALTLFALLCAFLGVVSTFWIRANVRRRDIGVMRSVGASSGRIVAQFVTEASLLVTTAFIVALPLLMHKVYAMGFASPIIEFLQGVENKSDYIHDVAWMHFAAVSFITYIIILLVAVVGAAIPAHRIAGILPSDALREE